MNDYFLRILSRQRHEEILNGVKASHFSQLERFRVFCGTKVIGIFRYLFCAAEKRHGFPDADSDWK